MVNKQLELDLIQRERQYAWERRCLNCDHTSAHTCDLNTQEVRCDYYVSQYGGGGGCICGKYVDASNFTQTQIDLIEIARHLPYVNQAPVQRIAQQLNIRMPEWKRVWRR